MALDFVNTVNDVRTDQGEYLNNPEDLARWAQHARVLTDDELAAVLASLVDNPAAGCTSTRARRADDDGARWRTAATGRKCGGFAHEPIENAVAGAGLHVILVTAILNGIDRRPS